MPYRLTSSLIAAMGALTVVSCAYQGGGDNPVARNLTWFSYLNGDDIRGQCKAGAPDRYRFVYNGIYAEQVRTYDLAVAGNGTDPVLQVRVLGRRGDLSRLTLDSPSAIFSPWSGRTETVHLRPQDLARLGDAMRAGGVFTRLTGRLELSSDSFYWVVAACRGGAFAFNAFRWPSPRFEAAAFPGLLFAWDPTGIPVNPPRQATPEQIYGRVMSSSDMRDAQRFDLAAEGNGLIGVGRLF